MSFSLLLSFLPLSLSSLDANFPSWHRDSIWFDSLCGSSLADDSLLDLWCY